MPPARNFTSARKGRNAGWSLGARRHSDGAQSHARMPQRFVLACEVNSLSPAIIVRLALAPYKAGHENDHSPPLSGLPASPSGRRAAGARCLQGVRRACSKRVLGLLAGAGGATGSAGPPSQPAPDPVPEMTAVVPCGLTAEEVARRTAATSLDLESKLREVDSAEEAMPAPVSSAAA